VFTKGNHNKQTLRLLLNCPASRIRLVHAPYHSEQHLPWAFRHYLPIPDDIFPLRWRDDYRPGGFWNLGKVSKHDVTNFDYEETIRSVDCGVYMAKSNIPNAGFGLFTGVSIPSSDVEVDLNAPAIPILFPPSLYDDMRIVDYVWAGHQHWLHTDGDGNFISEFTISLFGVSLEQCYIQLNVVVKLHLLTFFLLLHLCYSVGTF
jgi:hypothetical protein